MPAKKQQQDFESALKRLEEITDQLEAGDTSLEKSIELYTEGLKIAQFCQEKLQLAEKKIKIIRENSQQTVEEAFDESEGDH